MSKNLSGFHTSASSGQFSPRSAFRSGLPKSRADSGGQSPQPKRYGQAGRVTMAMRPHRTLIRTTPAGVRTKSKTPTSARYRLLTTALCLCLGAVSCGHGAEPTSTSESAGEIRVRDSLALMDSLRARVGGWEAQLLEALTDFKITCRVKEDSLMEAGQAMLNDSAFLLLRSEVKALSDSLRTSLVFGTSTSDEAQLQTLQLINSLTAESKTAEEVQQALLLFCDWARVKKDSTPIIQ